MSGSGNEIYQCENCICFGYRSPESEGEGLWDGVLVAHNGNGNTVYYFDENDFLISHDLSWAEIMDIGNIFRGDGWLSMELDDIILTLDNLVE
jgi:hypothetical protein